MRRLGALLLLLADLTAACSSSDESTRERDAAPPVDAATGSDDAGHTKTDAGKPDEAPADAGSHDAASVGCTVGEDVALDVLSAAVTGPDGAAPRKGDTLTVKLHVNNAGGNAGLVHLTVLVDSARFTDFAEVPFGSLDAMVVHKTI